MPQEIAAAAEAAVDGAHTNEEGIGGREKEVEEEAIASRRFLVKKKKKRGVIIFKPKRAAATTSSSSPASSTLSSSSVGTSRRRVRRWGPRSGDDDQDLAFSLGMSFAAFVSSILDGIKGSGDNIPIDRLPLICTSAIKESIANIYGNRFECFLLNFEKSFGSTLRTLQLINEVSGAGHRNGSQVPTVEQGNRTVSELSIAEKGNTSCSSFLCSDSCEVTQGKHESFCAAVEKFEDISPLTAMNNQIVLHGRVNQELALASHSFTGSGSTQSILSTFEKSVIEQTRSNDLKAYEISLISKKLQMKESQLALSSYANMLEKVKISMGISKASFKKEKLRNQMLDTRHAEFIRRCIDLLVTGLIIMSCCLLYGTYIYSYQRITEATSSCSVISKESQSWWTPKQVASISSGWLMMRCQFLAFSRLFFGLAMIGAIAYSVFQRSAVSTTTIMPVTSILLLGFVCGFFGKLCVDTLGGSGLYWLLHWETLCLLHFFANIFPSAPYRLIYGPVYMSPIKTEGKVVPYWLRRFLFNFILAIFYPAMAGLLPFATFGDWKEHFFEKISHLVIGVENQE